MRLWVSARIPFTPLRVGTSFGGRRRSGGAGCGMLFLLACAFLVVAGIVQSVWQLATTHSVWQQLLVGVLIVAGLVGAWALCRRPGPPSRPVPARTPAQDQLFVGMFDPKRRPAATPNQASVSDRR